MFCDFSNVSLNLNFWWPSHVEQKEYKLKKSLFTSYQPRILILVNNSWDIYQNVFLHMVPMVSGCRHLLSYLNHINSGVFVEGIEVNKFNWPLQFQRSWSFKPGQLEVNNPWTNLQNYLMGNWLMTEWSLMDWKAMTMVHQIVVLWNDRWLIHVNLRIFIGTNLINCHIELTLNHKYENHILYFIKRKTNVKEM